MVYITNVSNVSNNWYPLITLFLFLLLSSVLFIPLSTCTSRNVMNGNYLSGIKSIVISNAFLSVVFSFLFSFHNWLFSCSNVSSIYFCLFSILAYHKFFDNFYLYILYIFLLYNLSATSIYLIQIQLLTYRQFHTSILLTKMQVE